MWSTWRHAIASGHAAISHAIRQRHFCLMTRAMGSWRQLATVSMANILACKLACAKTACAVLLSPYAVGCRHSLLLLEVHCCVPIISKHACSGVTNQLSRSQVCCTPPLMITFCIHVRNVCVCTSASVPGMANTAAAVHVNCDNAIGQIMLNCHNHSFCAVQEAANTKRTMAAAKQPAHKGPSHPGAPVLKVPAGSLIPHSDTCTQVASHHQTCLHAATPHKNSFAQLVHVRFGLSLPSSMYIYKC